MENRPPQQEPPRRPPPNSARKTNGSSGGSPTPPWLWLLLLVGFGLIFYQFVPKAETSVRLLSLVLRSGSGRQHQVDFDADVRRFGASCGRTSRIKARRTQLPVIVKRFVTNAPSEASVDIDREEADRAQREEDGRSKKGRRDGAISIPSRPLRPTGCCG